MKTLVVGGGPGGLYLALLLKKANPAHDVTVVERNAPGVTFGWGVVFSDETLGYLQEHDEPTYEAISDTFARWDAIEVRYRGELIRSGGHGFSGIARRKLLDILQRRCRELGVRLIFNTEVEDFSRFSKYDLVVAADGVNSRVRKTYQDVFRPGLDVRRNKYAWFGTTCPFERFLFSFRQTEHGPFWCHAYRFDAHTSTFIVECDEATWRRAGLDRADEAASTAYCQRIFAADLEGHPLLTNRSLWISFTTVRNETWRHGRIVLLGDAAHTAHFSIGSGTRPAMEDSIALAAALQRHPDAVEQALAAYEDERKPIVERFQRAAQESLSWFEHVERYLHFEPLQLTASLLTRSRRISYDNLRLRDPGFGERLDEWFAERAVGRGDGRPKQPPPPIFTPLQLRGMRLENRVVVSPMCQYSAEDGTPNDWHFVHLGSRAIGGAGLVITEMTDISPEARITPGCAGMYRPEHVAAWKRIVDFVHAYSRAKICLQLAHAGRKGATRLMWEGMDEPLAQGAWPIISASPLPYMPHSQVPREMTRADMDAVRDDFVRAARMAERAGFDMLELHFAHGYLLSSFISPLTNARTDQYGGPLENRMRFPLEVFDAVRAVWPPDKPMSVRISATDWVPGGVTGEDAAAIGRLLKAHGCDVVDVSAGQTTLEARPVYGRMFQTPFSDQVRNEAGIPTMTVGNINTADEVNSILIAGRADLCVLARPHLWDPYWTLHAAAALEWDELRWPNQYQSVQPRPANSPFQALIRKQPATLATEILRLQERVAELERRLARQQTTEAPRFAARPPTGPDRPMPVPPAVQSVGDAAPLASPSPALDESGQADMVEMGETDDW